MSKRKSEILKGIVSQVKFTRKQCLKMLQIGFSFKITNACNSSSTMHHQKSRRPSPGSSSKMVHGVPGSNIDAAKIIAGSVQGPIASAAVASGMYIAGAQRNIIGANVSEYSCEVCRKVAQFVCSACRKAAYCSRECQVRIVEVVCIVWHLRYVRDAHVTCVWRLCYVCVTLMLRVCDAHVTIVCVTLMLRLFGA